MASTMTREEQRAAHRENSRNWYQKNAELKKAKVRERYWRLKAEKEMELVRQNVDLIQVNKVLSSRIEELESEIAALRASVTSTRARRDERIERQKSESMGIWPRIKTALLGLFNLAVFVAVVMMI